MANVRERFFIALVMTMVMASSMRAGSSAERTILGDWCAGSPGAFHEEFSLSIEGEERLFHSWLHQRPALSGTWLLAPRTLTIRGLHEDVFEYTIVSLTAKRLVLRAAGEKESETYVRTGCIPFDVEPRDDDRR